MIMDNIKETVKKEVDKRKIEENKKNGFEKLNFFSDSFEVEIRRNNGARNGNS